MAPFWGYATANQSSGGKLITLDKCHHGVGGDSSSLKQKFWIRFPFLPLFLPIPPLMSSQSILFTIMAFHIAFHQIKMKKLISQQRNNKLMHMESTILTTYPITFIPSLRPKSDSCLFCSQHIGQNLSHGFI